MTPRAKHYAELETNFTGFHTVDGFAPIARWRRDLRKGVFKTGQQC